MFTMNGRYNQCYNRIVVPIEIKHVHLSVPYHGRSFKNIVGSAMNCLVGLGLKGAEGEVYKGRNSHPPSRGFTCNDFKDLTKL